MGNIFEEAAKEKEGPRNSFMEAFWANGPHRMALSMYATIPGSFNRQGAQAIIVLYPNGTWELEDAK